MKEENLLPTPDIADARAPTSYKVLNLEALVRMKLTSFRTKDQMHLRDLIELEIVDAMWPARFQPELAARLQHLLDTPDG